MPSGGLAFLPAVMLLLDGIPVRILRREGGRVLVTVGTFPFPRWIDAASLVKREPAPFIPAPF